MSQRTDVERAVQRWRLNPVASCESCSRPRPDTWQAKALGAFSTDPRLAIKSGKGPGRVPGFVWMEFSS